MKFARFLPHAGIIACLAFICIYGAFLEGQKYFVSWAVFQTWALYFIAGAKIKEAIRAYVCYLLGVAASILIFWLSASVGAGELVVTIIASIVTFGIICIENVPYINYIPAYFLGAGACFALAPFKGSYGNLFVVMLVTVIAGGILGWATVFFRTMYGTWLAKQDAAKQVQAAPVQQQAEAQQVK